MKLKKQVSTAVLTILFFSLTCNFKGEANPNGGPEIAENSIKTADTRNLQHDRHDEPEAERQYRRVEIKDTEARSLMSEHVGREYKLDVFFPKDYHIEKKRYPCVYVLDAEYNFGCVSYIARRLIKNEDIPKVLLIGIAYDTTYEDFYDKRYRDSTPESNIHNHNSGGAVKFTSFVEKELIPFIDRNYRTVPGDRTLVGHSITGFYCCYVLFRHPGLFLRYIIVSPSVWFSRNIAFEYEKDYSLSHEDMKASVYLSVGDGESRRMKEDSISLNSVLTGRAYPNLRLKFSLVEDENHRSLFPYAFSKGMRFIFSQ